MTCGLAVKRPHDYEAYLSPDSGVEVKRSRTTNPHCSPFRPQLGTLAASLLQSTSTSAFAKESEKNSNVETGPFGPLVGKHQLSENQLESYLRAEVQYLKRRKLIPHHHVDKKNVGGSNDGNLMMVDGKNYRCSAASPSSSHSGSESDGEPASPPHLDNALSSRSGGEMRAALSRLYEKPQFSLKQVKLICERLLKEQEIRLRYEYETALNKKLEEQHDQYVQFAKEQIDSQNANNKETDFFYLS